MTTTNPERERGVPTKSDMARRKEWEFFSKSS
jgi:hypothetical protein